MNSTDYLIYVSEMLSTHDAVVIPGFGGFITRYKPAMISEEAGKIYPPTKYIAFNEQLDIHDNTFARFLDENTSAHYSPRLFDHFIAKLKSDLTSHQVIVVPKVGRLYQDFDGVTHFMPDLLNLNNDAFALPQLDIAKGDWGISVIGQASEELKHGSIKTALAVAATAVLLLIVVLGGSGALGGLEKDRAAELNIIDTVTKRVDEVDQTSEDDHKSSVEVTASDENRILPDLVESSTKDDSKDLTSTSDIELPKAVIIVGAFGSEANAVKMIGTVESFGYQGYQDKPSKLNRVGVEVSYNSEDELNSILATVQKDITSRAWILK